MTQPMDENERRQRLMAYADGELTGVDKVSALEEMADDQEATRAVIHQTQLREAVARSMQDEAPAAPAALRDQLADMVATEPIARIGTGGTGGAGGLSRWAPAIAAALVVVGGVVFLNIVNSQRSSSGGTDLVRQPHAQPEVILTIAMWCAVPC